MPLIILACVIMFLMTLLKTPRFRGSFGEFIVKLVIGKNKPSERYVINDLRLRVGENKTSQIDHIVINPNGVFVIETKNYSGRIYGQESQLEWTQVLNYGRVKNKVYNPIKQNKTHIYHISNLLPPTTPVHSVVVFVQGNTKYINANGVYTLGGLRGVLKRSRETTLSAEQMEEIYSLLSNATDSSVSNREHIQNIRAMSQSISNDICPRCGKNLVLRHGKNGDFMGCSGYPNCKFTKNIVR